MFSSGKSSTGNGGSQRDETNTTAKNLAVWSETDNSWIQADLTGETVKTGWTSNGANASSGSSGSGSSTENQTLDTNTKEATKKHNGVKWTYKNPSASTSSTGRAESSTTNEITITGQVNIYKSVIMSGNTVTSSYQTYIKNPSGTTTAADTSTGQVTVTITLVPKTTTATSRK